MKLLAIDPAYAKPYGFSFWVDGRLVEKGLFGSMDIASDLVSGADFVVIEDQYNRFNYKVSKGLSLAAGKILGLCEYFNVDYQIINIAKWQNYFNLYKSIQGMKGQKRKIAKVDLTIEKARQYDEDINDVDIASAVLIGAYTVDTL